MKRLSFSIFPCSCLVLAVWVACGGPATPPVSAPVTNTAATNTSATNTAATNTATVIPDGFTSITASLTVSDVDAALAFYSKAFNATKQMSLPGPDGKTMHAEMRIGDSVMMLSASDPQRGNKAPSELGGTNGSILLYVEDVDAAMAQALAAGAKATMPVGDMFWGDRYGSLVDPSGHMWGLATHKEDVASEEMTTRAYAWMLAASKGEAYTTPADKTPAKSFMPDGYHSITASLLLKGGADELAFYTDLGAELIDKMPTPDGRLLHAALKFGDSIIHFSSEFPTMAPTHKAGVNLGGSPLSVYFYVANVDDSYAAAIKRGATAVAPLTDMFWGDRWGPVIDPSGNVWGLATHKEDLTKEQIAERMSKQFGGAPSGN